jgi:Na+-transporting methylmalonyl-CoA/oxaloacetate decarboxylase beta subunit
VPIGFGILVGNVPFFKGFGIGIYEDNSVLHYLYFGVTTGLYPSIVFLGLGAMTDFGSLLARPVPDAARRGRPDGDLFHPAERPGPGLSAP